MRALAEQEPLLIFRVGPVLCCAPVRDVDSIVIPQPLTHFPGQAADVAGVFQYRSHTVSVQRLRTKFGLPELEDVTKGRIIMAYTHKGLTGFWADDIEEITSGYEAHFRDPPVFAGGNIFDKTLLWNEKIILHTDFERLSAMRDAAPMKNWIDQHDEELNQNKEVQVEDDDDENKVVSLQSDDTDNESGVVEQEEAALTEGELNEYIEPQNGQGEGQAAESEQVIEDGDAEQKDVEDSSSADEIQDLDSTVFEESREKNEHEALIHVEETSTEQEVAADEEEPINEITETTSGEEHAEINEVDTELYEHAMAALEEEETVEEGVAELRQDLLETGEISNYIDNNEAVDEVVSETPETEPFQAEHEYAVSEIEPYDEPNDVEPIEPIVPDNEYSSSEIITDSKIDLHEDAVPPYKLIAGATALVLVAAVVGYMVFGGEEEVVAKKVTVQQQVKPTEQPDTMPQLAEIIIPDQENSDGSDTSIETMVDSETQSSGAIGTESEQEDKVTKLIPLETTVAGPPMQPLEPQLPVWGVHVVSEGDTLWYLAKRYLNDPFRFIDLAKWNGINNPDLIFPGDSVNYQDLRESK
jgi:chemotaxis signal transduction protein/nucleoid-associated protein YgaU